MPTTPRKTAAKKPTRRRAKPQPQTTNTPLPAAAAVPGAPTTPKPPGIEVRNAGEILGRVNLDNLTPEQVADLRRHFARKGGEATGTMGGPPSDFSCRSRLHECSPFQIKPRPVPLSTTEYRELERLISRGNELNLERIQAGRRVDELRAELEAAESDRDALNDELTACRSHTDALASRLA